jgi:hypothetical protein
MIFWYNICTEIRHEILLRLARAVPRKKHSLSKYACVSKEWQIFFEQHIFRKLQVTTSDLNQFEAVFAVHRRRAYLQHLGLKISFPKQSFRFLRLDCTKEENRFAKMMLLSRRGRGAYENMSWLVDQQRKTSQGFDYTLHCLFRRLIPWIIGEVHRHGIKLEIIADSKSHWQEAAARIRQRTRPLALYAPDGQVVSSGLKGKVLDTADLDFDFSLDVNQLAWRFIPMVHVISSFSIRRKSIRHFNPMAIGHILSHLPNLRAVTWEVRPHAHWKTEHWFCEELQKTVYLWPVSLKVVNIIQLPHEGPQGRPNPHLQSLVSKLSTRFQGMKFMSTYSSTNDLLFSAGPANSRNAAELDDREV